MAHILVADDEDYIRSMVQETLGMQGHIVDLAVNGHEAVEMLKKNVYDLVILDRNMPVLTGIDALTIIRANPKYNGLKVLMLTSASVTKEIDEAFQAGANGYILKPFAVPKFLEKVERTLKQS